MGACLHLCQAVEALEALLAAAQRQAAPAVLQADLHGQHLVSVPFGNRFRNHAKYRLCARSRQQALSLRCDQQLSSM